MHASLAHHLPRLNTNVVDFYDYIEQKKCIFGFENMLYEQGSTDDYSIEIRLTPTFSSLFSHLSEPYQKMLQTLLHDIFHHDLGFIVQEKTTFYIPQLHAIIPFDALYLKPCSIDEITSLERYFLLDIDTYISHKPTIIQILPDLTWICTSLGHEHIAESVHALLPSQFVSNPL